jgi:microcystin-dependent protein
VIKKTFAPAIAALLAALVVYSFIPPPQPASAALSDQATFGGTSGGSANAQTINIPNLPANTPGVQLRFIPGFTNTGPTQINVSGIGLVDVLRPSSIGNVGFSGGEFQAGELTCVIFNGTAYQLACNVDLTPIGRTVESRGSVAPRGSIIEDGSCVSQTTYAALFSVIGSTYGSCSAGLFKLPFSNGTAFVAFDNQGANGPANRITTASCATPNSPVECGSQLATLTAAQIPSITSANGAQSISVNSTVGDVVQGSITVFGIGSGGLVEGLINGSGASGTLASSGTNSISVTSNNTGGSSVSHPVQNPMLPGIRAIKY